MALSAFKVLHRSYIPGTVGYDTSGNPKQAKVRVIGEYTDTSYATGGTVLARNKFGVSAVDIAHFWPKGFLPTATRIFLAQYDDTNQKVVVHDIDAAPAELANTTSIGVVRFEVVGDASLPTENTISDSINTGLPV